MGIKRNSFRLKHGAHPDCELRELIQTCQQKNPRAIESLTQQLRSWLTRNVPKRLGPELKGELETDDVCQEVSLEVVRRLTKFKYFNDKMFWSWVSGILDNKLRDLVHRMHAKKRSRTDPSELPDRAPTSKSWFQIPEDTSSPSPLDLIADDELIDLVLRCLKRLPRQEAIFIRAHYLEGLNVSQAAHKAEIPETTARSNHPRMLARLAYWIGRQELENR